MTAKHTPTPWYIEMSGGEYTIKGSNGQTVLLIGDDRRLIPMPNDGELILRAVNAHEALVVALEAVCKWAGGDDWKTELLTGELDQFKCFDPARAALAKARGEG